MRLKDRMDINQKITDELGVKRWQVDAAVRLIDEGNTIPFIARYRKEATGTLDDAQLRTLHERLSVSAGTGGEEGAGALYHRGAGKTDGGTERTDPGRTNPGGGGGSLPPLPSEATDKGHHCKGEGTGAAGCIYHAAEREGAVGRWRRRSMWILEKEVQTPEDAIAGARDIIAESISDDADYRSHIRKLTGAEGENGIQSKG